MSRINANGTTNGTDIPVVTPSNMGNGLVWDASTGKYNVIPQGSIKFANEAEIDAGGSTNADKAVSADEYRKEILVQEDAEDFLDSQVRVGLRTMSGTNCSTVVGNGAGAPYDYITAIGYRAGNRIDPDPGHPALGAILIGNETHQDATNVENGIAIGTRAWVGGRRTISIGLCAGAGSTADNNINIGPHAGQGCSSDDCIFIGYQRSSANLEYAGTNIIMLGNDARHRHTESNYVLLGNHRVQNVYTTGRYNGTAFNTTSDEKVKYVGDLVATKANGIELRKFTYITNRETTIGWVAQQVKQLLVSRGYEEDVINMALPVTRDIDWKATIQAFNEATNSSIQYADEMQPAYDAYVLAKARNLNVTELTVKDFMDAVDATPEANRTEWQINTYNTLKSLLDAGVQQYYVWDDILTINKQLVEDLLSA